jgi:hypothetical protein
MTDPGLLILSDTYYPGWKVTVDGQPAQLLRTNYALRGVYLSTGKHQVVFRFAPHSLQLGLVSTGTTLFVGLILLLLSSPICRTGRNGGFGLGAGRQQHRKAELAARMELVSNSGGHSCPGCPSDLGPETPS